MRFVLGLLLVVFGAGTVHAEIAWEVARTLPHDREAFTQGLFIDGDFIYESTGQVGQSELRVMRLEDAELVRRQPMRADVFGEGSTLWDDRIISITWQDGTAFVWQREDLTQVGSFSYAGEGWGLTQDGASLIMSDGTPELRFLDPETFEEQRRVTVTWEGQPVRFLNELEYVDGAVYANIWFSPMIAKIDPATGVIDGWINLSALMSGPADHASEGVLNGIAWDPAAELLYVTGKNWSKMYALRLIE